MAITLGLNAEEILLQEGFILYGSVATPELIGQTGGGDPLTHFTPSGTNGLVGWIKKGTININIEREYVAAESNTPTTIVRNDLIAKSVMVTFENFQINADLWKIEDGLLVYKGYTDSGFTGDVATLGSNEPAQTNPCVLVKTKFQDGTPYYYMIYNGKVSGSPSEARSSEHVARPIEITGLPHPSFDIYTDDTADQQWLGCKWKDLTP